MSYSAIKNRNIDTRQIKGSPNRPSGRFDVHGSSMFPMIADGASVRGEPASPEQLAIGDMVTYIDSRNRLVTHRIVEVRAHESGRLLVVCGDNSSRTETIKAESVAYRILEVDNRTFSYRVDSPIGRLFSRIALAENNGYALLKTVIHRTWNIARSVNLPRRRPVR